MNSDLHKLPYPLKVLFSSYLILIGLAYLIAVLYIFLMDVEPYDKTGFHVLEDTIQKYYGRRGDTRLEGVLKGSMGAYVSKEEKKEIVDWVNRGATKEEFAEVKPIFETNCIQCHSPASGMNLIPLTTYDEVKKVTNIDRGESIKTLAAGSHVHIFGISMVFLLSGTIFSLGRMNRHAKAIIIVIPFVAMAMDIGSWWFTKYDPIFAYTVIIGGLLIGISLAIQIFYSLFEMWLARR